MNRRNQLLWMVLLAAAVILPTVSLLWFMSRVVANERLVIQQKLAAVYQDKLKEAGEPVRRRFNERLAAFNETDWTQNPYGLLQRLVLDEHFQGVVILDSGGKVVYPSNDASSGSDESTTGPLADARRLEFVDQDYAAAAARYGELVDSTDSRALAGQVRCLARLGRWDEAMNAALRPQEASAAPARLLLLTLLQKAEGVAGGSEKVDRLIVALEHDLFKTGSDHLPASQNHFIAHRLLENMGKRDGTERLKRLAEAESRSMHFQEEHVSAHAGPVDTLVPIHVDGTRMYIVRHPTPFGELRIVLTNEGLASALDGYASVFGDDEIAFRILDERGRLIAGKAGRKSAAVASMPLPKGFPEGRVELFFSDVDTFNKAAGRQITVYVWTGVLVILLMLVVGSFAVYAIGRQIRLNKMKNDFIATVSHELKTPLASMRVLVDTLLEGRTRDEAHAEDYLRMISRENERLTRMIDNFLSFSRMERNKNAFTFAPASPAAIVNDAIESVCTKYDANGCRLETHLADNLPLIRADHDAVVTVLINLLDNACKYTDENKQIKLAVSLESDEICFAISDNGVGMSRRQVRKIFDSFFRVDDSLSRTTEGCGLGLSIVQFIVNAHKGRIEVDSQPGQGSTFTVRLPIHRENGA